MKNLLTLLALMFTTFSLSAQFVVLNSPDELAGTYSFSAAAFGADLTTDIWTGDAAFVDDGSDNPTVGCMDPVNPSDLNGKIALIDRGACEFGTKCLGAENAGAIGAVVFNNAPEGGTITMGAGAVGNSVTIPCVMVSFEDGQIIREAMANGATINITIGDVQFDNNIGVTPSNILVAPIGSIPAAQLSPDGVVSSTIVPGALVNNFGVNDAANVSLSATIDYAPSDGAPSQVYSEMGSSKTIFSDSSTNIVLPPFTPMEKGFYEVTYNLTYDAEDEVPNDNQVTTAFSVTDNAFSRVPWDDANNRPSQNGTLTIAGGGPLELFSSFYLPNPEGHRIDSVVFLITTSSPSLAGETIEAYIYNWTDLNADSTMNNDELTILGLAPFIFDASETATQAWLTLPILDFETLDEEEPGYLLKDTDNNIVVGLRYQGANTVFFGFNTNHDLTEYITYAQAQGIFTDLHWPYIGVNTWDGIQPDIDAGFLFLGNRTTISTGLYINEIVSDVEDILSDEEVQLQVYPNPVADKLMSDITLQEPSSKLEYRITDTKGRLIFTAQRTNVKTDQATFNIAALPVGQYFLTIQLDKGRKIMPFVVQR